MTLTKKQAIKECKALWEAIEKSGLSKWDFLKTDEGAKWKGKGWKGNCPLCEYASQIRDGDCSDCPLLKKYKKLCPDLGYLEANVSTPEWFKAVREL